MNSKNNYVYPAIIKKEDGEEILEFVDFPDLIVSISDNDEFVEAAQEVLALQLLDEISQGKQLPEPTKRIEGGIYIHVWLPYYKNMAKEIYIKKTVTIPQWLDLLAKENHVNFSACLVNGIKKELGIM